LDEKADVEERVEEQKFDQSEEKVANSSSLS